jgi:hypothetical protein
MSQQRLKIFLSFKACGPAVGSTQPPVQWITVNVPIEVKWLGHKAVNSPPSSAEGENEGRCALHSLICLCVMVRDSFAGTDCKYSKPWFAVSYDKATSDTNLTIVP